MKPIYRIWDNNSKEYMIDCVEGIIYFVKQDGELCSIDEDSFIGLPSGQDYTIELCTGLKDVNGNWIYEGDLLKRGEYNQPLRPLWVVFQDGLFAGRHHTFAKTSTTELAIFELNTDRTIWKVIGNIHQNPELLKETKDES